MRKEYIPYAELPDLVRDTGSKRLAVPGLREAILGGLAYLYDTQVRDPRRYTANRYNFLPAAEFGHKPWPWLISSLRSFTGNHIIREKHIAGSWPGYIHLIEVPEKIHAHPFQVATDYNLFTTVSTAYPLLLFDDRPDRAGKSILSEMLEDAGQAVMGFKRGDAFNFWRLKYYKAIGQHCAAPLNVPVSIIDFRVNIYKYTKKLGFKEFKESGTLFDWFTDCYEKRINPSGSSAIFNIPNDADNTSMAVAFQALHNQWKDNDPGLTDFSPLEKLPAFLDRNRSKNDRYSKITGTSTGAFLTWLKDENLPTFGSPESGVIPLGVNNVDIIVNSNALMALSLAGKTDLPGYRDAIRLLCQTIEDYSWHHASLYYPQRYIFPYSVSRAWRDAGIHEPLLDRAMHLMLKQILSEVVSIPGFPDHYNGAFPVNRFNNFYQSTALGLITLLNLGRQMAKEEGLAVQFDQIVSRAVLFLLSGRLFTRFRNRDSAEQLSSVDANYWESGVLYSSSVHQLANWRSHAQTTALVLEALAKYALAYDLGENSMLTRRLILTKNNGKWFLSDQPANH